MSKYLKGRKKLHINYMNKTNILANINSHN